jgi:hypothetical protein
MFSSGLYNLVFTVSSSVFSFFIGKSRSQIPFPALFIYAYNLYSWDDTGARLERAPPSLSVTEAIVPVHIGRIIVTE